MGNVVLSLRSGGGDTFTRGLNEVQRKINGGALKKYMHTWHNLTQSDLIYATSLSGANRKQLQSMMGHGLTQRV